MNPVKGKGSIVSFFQKVPRSAPVEGSQVPPQAEVTVRTSRRSARLATQPSVAYEDSDSDPSPAVPTIPLPPRAAKAAAIAKSTATVSGPGRGRAKKYIIKHYFDNKTCHALSQGYSQAVYNNIDKGVEGQSRAVMAVIWHQLDHPESTAAEKGDISPVLHRKMSLPAMDLFR